MSDGVRSDTSLSADAEFFVGYLPIPPRLARFLLRGACVITAVAASAASLLITFRHDPGDGVWSDAVAQGFEGWIEASPYPILHVIRADAGTPSDALLLVEMGKIGGGQRAMPFAGQFARVNGWVIERDGRRMLELEPGPAAIESLPRRSDAPMPSDAPTASAVEVVMKGEIVDSKCYLGAMKPGDGKTHKQCAMRCIDGGIPPMLVAVSATGKREYYLLTSADGGRLDRAILTYVGEPVEIHGRIIKRRGISYLALDPSGIFRL